MAQAPNSTTAANASTSRASSRREEEQLSAQRDPTELVRAYLAERGQPATAQNIRNVLEQNRRAQNEGGPGLIPELRSQEAPPPDTTAPRRAGGGNAPRESNRPVELGNTMADTGVPDPTRNTATTRAAPAGASTPLPSPGAPFTASGGDTVVVDPGTGIPGTASPAGMGNGQDAVLPLATITALQIAQAIKNGQGAGQFMGNMPMPPTGRVMDVPGTAIPAPAAQAAIPAPPATGLEAPMAKAMEPATPPAVAAPQQALPAPPPSGRTSSTIVDPYAVIREGQQLPAGINPNSVPTQPTGPMTTNVPANNAGAPRVPLPAGRNVPPDAGILESFINMLRGARGLHLR